jgi:CBS domain-containing protein
VAATVAERGRGLRGRRHDCTWANKSPGFMNVYLAVLSRAVNGQNFSLTAGNPGLGRHALELRADAGKTRLQWGRQAFRVPLAGTGTREHATHEPLISRTMLEEVPLAGLSLRKMPSGACAHSERDRGGYHANGAEVPLLPPDASVEAAIVAMNKSVFGGVLVSSATGLEGVFSDGDLRRLVRRGLRPDVPLSEVMTPRPITVAPNATGAGMLTAMESSHRKIYFLPVIDDQRHVVGIVGMHESPVAEPRYS